MLIGSVGRQDVLHPLRFNLQGIAVMQTWEIWAFIVIPLVGILLTALPGWIVLVRHWRGRR